MRDSWPGSSIAISSAVLGAVPAARWMYAR